MNELTSTTATLTLVPENEGDRFHLAEAYLASLGTETGRRGMKTSIRRLAEIYLEGTEPFTVAPGEEDLPLWSRVPWHSMNAAGVDAMLAKVEGAPATRNKALAAMRGIARAGFRMGVISADTFAKVKDTRGVPGSREKTGRDVARAELDLILAACRTDPRASARRDAAMIAFGWATGARREEIVRLTMDDISDTETEHGPTLSGTLLGKGNKERTFYVFNGFRLLILEWLAIRGTEPGPVFCATTKAGEICTGEGISTTSAHRALIRRASQAGVEDLSWHDFRRTAAGDLMDGGTDIATVAAILGHASVVTTQRYDRRGERTKKAAMAKR